MRRHQRAGAWRGGREEERLGHTCVLAGGNGMREGVTHPVASRAGGVEGEHHRTVAQGCVCLGAKGAGR